MKLPLEGYGRVWKGMEGYGLGMEGYGRVWKGVVWFVLVSPWNGMLLSELTSGQAAHVRACLLEGRKESTLVTLEETLTMARCTCTCTSAMSGNDFCAFGNGNRN